MQYIRYFYSEKGINYPQIVKKIYLNYQNPNRNK